MRICLYCCGLWGNAYATPLRRVGTRNSRAPSGVDLKRSGVSTSVKCLRSACLKRVATLLRNLNRSLRRGSNLICRWRDLRGHAASLETMMSLGNLLRHVMKVSATSYLSAASGVDSGSFVPAAGSVAGSLFDSVVALGSCIMPAMQTGLYAGTDFR